MQNKKLTVAQHLSLSQSLRESARKIDDAQRVCESYSNENYNLLYHFGKINSFYTTSHFKKVLLELDTLYQEACQNENNYNYPEDIYFQTYNLE